MGLFPGASGLSAANLAGVAVMGGIIYGALVAWQAGRREAPRRVLVGGAPRLRHARALRGDAELDSGRHPADGEPRHLDRRALPLVGVIYDRRHTRAIAEFGGLAKVMPIYAAVLLIITFASIGVPGTNGFVGEFMVIIGTMRLRAPAATSPGSTPRWPRPASSWRAVYMLSVTQKMFFGPLTNPKNKRLSDLTVRETLALAPLVALRLRHRLLPFHLPRPNDGTPCRRSSSATKRFGLEGRDRRQPASRLAQAERRSRHGTRCAAGAAANRRPRRRKDTEPWVCSSPSRRFSIVALGALL